MAHEIPYVATATVAELHDLEAKVERAMELRGPRYLHVLVSCPLGWGAASADSIRIARLAKECGLFPVFEAENGEVTAVSKIRRQVPVEDYLRPQRRFAHLFEPELRPRTSRVSRRAPTATSNASGCCHERQAVRDHARPAVEPRQQDRQLAYRAPGLRAPRRAVRRRLPGLRGPAGVALPRRGGRLRDGLAADHGRQPVPGDHGARLLPPVRGGVQPRSARRGRRASTPSSASSATRRSSTDGPSSASRRPPASACWSSARGRRGWPPPTT